MVNRKINSAGSGAPGPVVLVVDDNVDNQEVPVVPAVPPADAAGEVDLKALSSLGEQIGAEALRDVLETFWEETGKRLARLGDAVTTGDWQEAAAAAHAIKGGSASLGYVRVVELSNEVQHLAEAGALLEAAERCAALVEAFGRAQAGGAQLVDSIRAGDLAPYSNGGS